MNFHWQNLNDKPGGRQGSGLRHGRAWLRFSERSRAEAEWSFGAFRFGIGLSVSSERGLQFQFTVPLISLYLAIYLHALRDFFYRWDWHHLEVRVFDWAIWLSLWIDDTGWKQPRFKWQRCNWHPLDTLLGRSKYSERDITTERTVIPMPEGVYPATVRLFEAKWGRPRWFPKYLVRSDTTPDTPIPVPGKGENSWDCGDDHISSQTTGECRTVEAAVAKFVETCLRTRQRYGGRNWKPAAGWPQERAAS